MRNPDDIFGRLGNRMFQMAFIYAWAKENRPLFNGLPDFYLQDVNYFDRYKDEIKRLYGDHIPSQTDMVAIHVRRGDYVNNPFYVDLSQTTYYEDAMAQFPDADFLVFSDDIEWCKKQPIFKNCEFSHTLDLEEMNLMASCIGHIIANSTFSFWGAYISPYSKKTIAPIKWFSDGIQRVTLPNNWTRI